MSRILVVTRGDYLTKLVLQPLFRSGMTDLAVVVVSGDDRGRTGLSRLQNLWRRSEPHYFGYELSQYLIFRLGRFLLPRAALSVESLARQHGARVLTVPRVNHPDVLAFAEELAPDLMVSVKCPQRIADDLLRVPALGSINVHASLLPRFAGRAAHFWAMSSGETHSGATVHRMTSRFDAGPVLVQRSLRIPPRVSAFELLRRVSCLGGEALMEAIPLVLSGAPGAPQDSGARSYYSHPTTASYRRFRRRGFRLMRPSDVVRALRSERCA